MENWADFMAPSQKAAQKISKTSSAGKRTKIFTDEEIAAMKDHVQAMKGGTVGEDLVLAKIAEMKEPDRSMAKRLHAVIKASAPGLVPRLWYGMPAYGKDDKVVCFFQPATKFKTRYATFGFSDRANLDEGSMWPNSYALKELTAAEEGKISTLVRKAVS